MKAGRELEKLIAAQVMGLKVVDNNIVRDGQRSGIPRYSTNIADAWKVVEKLQADGYMYSISSILANGKFITQVEFARNTDFDLKWYKETTKTAPLAICLAALRCKGIDIDGSN